MPLKSYLEECMDPPVIYPSDGCIEGGRMKFCSRPPALASVAERETPNYLCFSSPSPWEEGCRVSTCLFLSFSKVRQIVKVAPHYG